MAESSTHHQQPAARRPHANHTHVYWCHKCQRRVNGQTLDNNQVVCSQCNDGFITSNAPSPSLLDEVLQHMQGLEIHQNNDRGGLHEDSLRMRLLQMMLQNMGAGRVGNIGDYADEAEYQSILLNLADSDDGANRGAPPAAESAVAALKNVKIESGNEAVMCVVCKDLVTVGDTATELPCGHGYHQDCILTWLATRNMCPVCRYELPTSNPDYEEERIKNNSSGSPKPSNYLPHE